MNNNPLISIIVPVYKVERYLPRCIESIIKQTYTNFELILVDDGTPDRSGMICDMYAEKDSRIRVIHKENGGVSTARNTGIDAAKGEWITFVDSDDWVNCVFLKSFLENEVNDADVLVGSYNMVRTRIQTCVNADCEVDTYNYSDDVAKTLESFMFVVPWGKMFKTDIIKENQIKFPVGIKWGEDSHFVTEYLTFCKKIKFVRNAVYNYNCINQSSITNKQVWIKEKLLWDKEYIGKYQKLLEAYGVEEKIRKATVSKKALIICVLDIRTIALNSETLDDAKNDMISAINTFGGWIFAEKDWIYEQGNEVYRRRFESLEQQDVQALFDCFQVKKIKLSDKIKRRIKKILNPLLEKYRDGLIKFKF